MKKLLKNTIYLFVPVVVILALLPVNKRMKYQGLKDDCFYHGLWVYDRIYNNETPIDIAFLGSSHTVNGINDKIITEIANCGKAVNLGYCRFGRNLNYTIFKELIRKKNPKILVLEVREGEDGFSHPIYPFMSDSKDVLLPNMLFNRDVFSDVWVHLAYKVELFQDFLFSHEKPADLRKNDYGFHASKDTAAAIWLDEVKRERSVPRKTSSKLDQAFHNSFPNSYIKKIAKTCQKKNIEIVFLYLPSYGTYLTKPKNENFYRKYGEILIPPDSILTKQANWFDSGHFNKTGAKELALWLSGELKRKQ